MRRTNAPCAPRRPVPGGAPRAPQRGQSLRAVDRPRQRAARAHAGLQDAPRLLEEPASASRPRRRRAGPRDRRAARTAPRSARRCRCPAATVWSSSTSPIGACRRERVARTPHGDGDLRVVVEQIGPEAAQGGVEGDARAIEQLEHRPAELHGAGCRSRSAPARRCAASAPTPAPRRRRARRPSCAGASGGCGRCRSLRADACRAPRPTRARGRRAPRRARAAPGSPGPRAATRWPTSGAMRSAASSRVCPSGRASASRAASGASGLRRIRRP